MSEQKKPNPLVLLVALGAGLWLLGGNKLSLPELALPSLGVSQPAIPAPSAELQTAVKPVKAAMKDKDASVHSAVSGIYAALAKLIGESDDIDTMAKFQAVQTRVSVMVGEVEGMSDMKAFNDAVDVVLKGAVGDEDGVESGPIDDANRKKLADALNAVAWASL